MVRVVEPDADHLADAGERAAESGMAADRGQPRHVELLQALERGRGEHLRRDVVDHRGQRAELAVGADDAGLLRSESAISHESHESLPVMRGRSLQKG
jgi:hypothetical protein